ncbi:MAG: hypothetical protein AAFQ65_05490 [Myxococcota bacterium]
MNIVAGRPSRLASLEKHSLLTMGFLLFLGGCFDFSDGYVGSCGNDFVDDNEECDAGSGNSDVEANACRSSCTFASCGDGVVDEGESCDSADPTCVNCQQVQASDPGDDDNDGEQEPTDPGLVAGTPCTQGSQCASDSCVDGICCDVMCSGSCQACQSVATGLEEGTCGPILAGADPRDECEGGLSCDGQGACFAKTAGQVCASDNECVSGFCTDGVCCPSRCGDTCRDCRSGTCAEVRNAPDPDTCSSCFGDATCTGRDVLEECANGTECSSGICVDNTCRKRDGSTCAGNAECENDACIGGSCTSPSGILDPCDDSTDCQSNLACTGGFCLVPDGSPCITDTQCVNLCILGSCAPMSGPLGGCENSGDCIEDLFCTSDECIIPTGSDVICSSSAQCEVICAPDGGRCSELLGNNEFCTSSTQCLSGRCNPVLNFCF